MKEFWDERYAAEEYVYGKEPNSFFKSWIDRLQPGSALFPGEGEGRNAVYAASLDWKVTAFDQSEVAREKSLKLAAERRVGIEYLTGSVLDIKLDGRSFDMITLIFFHLPSGIRNKYHQYLTSHLSPGGLIIMEAFGKKQLGKTTGGPQNIDMLYDLQDIGEDFSELEVLHAYSGRVNLDEGRFHKGVAEVIRFVGKK